MQRLIIWLLAVLLVPSFAWATATGATDLTEVVDADEYTKDGFLWEAGKIPGLLRLTLRRDHAGKFTVAKAQPMPRAQAAIPGIIEIISAMSPPASQTCRKRVSPSRT